MTIDKKSFVPFTKLNSSDLIVDRLYASGSSANVSDDVISKLIPGVGNLGGFRKGNKSKSQQYVVLSSSGRDLNWPDHLDPYTGVYTYFGDNRQPGSPIHDTTAGGNQLLAQMWANLEGPEPLRNQIPPIFIFERSYVESLGHRPVKFLGLAVPGTATGEDDLVAVWRSAGGKRFQNYMARFTVLDVGTVSRAWLNEIIEGTSLGPACPEVWRSWVKTGVAAPLTAPPVVRFRNKDEQLPVDQTGTKMIKAIHQHFSSNFYEFEACAIELFRFLEPNVSSLLGTPKSGDGGRDGIGRFKVGPDSDPIEFDFALEAKCLDPSGKGVGLKETSRLISRLRHRQFGVLITTSHVQENAYKEIRDDGHPIAVIAAVDIVNILKKQGMTSKQSVIEWLNNQFPIGEI